LPDREVKYEILNNRDKLAKSGKYKMISIKSDLTKLQLKRNYEAYASAGVSNVVTVTRENFQRKSVPTIQTNGTKVQTYKAARIPVVSSQLHTIQEKHQRTSFDVLSSTESPVSESNSHLPIQSGQAGIFMEFD